MSSESERRRYAENMARDWANKGQLMEGGWRAYRALLMKPDMIALAATPNGKVVEATEALLRKLFFMGAQHLFASVMAVMDSGEEPTDFDLRRLALIQKELNAFELELRAAGTVPPP